MKQNLGRMMIFLIFPFLLFAQEEYVKYSYLVSKENVYQYESIAFSLKVEQIYDKEVMFFELVPKQNDDVIIELISKKRSEASYHSATKEYSYLLIPKKEGNIVVSFELYIRLASDDAVAQTYVGSRDNVKYIPTKKVAITTLHIPLEVKRLPKDVIGVGKFVLKQEYKQKQLYSYDPFDIRYTLEGVGYLKKGFKPLKEIPFASVFEGITQNLQKVTPKGYQYKKVYNYAIVSQKSFMIQQKKFRYYDPKTNSFVYLVRPKVEVTLHQRDIKTLVDTTVSPQPKKSFLTLYFIDGIYYFIAFLLGFFSREIYKKYLKNNIELPRKKQNPIRSLDTPEKLLDFLVKSEKKEQFSVEIFELETIVYRKKNLHHFEKIKKDILKKY